MSRASLMRSLGLGAIALAAWAGLFVESCMAEGRTVSVAQGSQPVPAPPQPYDAANSTSAYEFERANEADGWYRRYLGDYGKPNPGGPVQWYPVNSPYRHVPMFGAPSASFYPGGRFGRWDANGNWGYWGGEGYPGYNGYTGW